MHTEFENNKNDEVKDNLEKIIEETKEKIKDREFSEEKVEEKVGGEKEAEVGDEGVSDNVVEGEVIFGEEKAIKIFYKNLFEILSRKIGEHWRLEDVEAEMLAKPTKAVLDKYMVKITPEGALVMNLMVVLAPRIVLSLTKKQ